MGLNQDNSIKLGRTGRTLSPSVIPDFLESHAMDGGHPSSPSLSFVCLQTDEGERGEEV